MHGVRFLIESHYRDSLLCMLALECTDEQVMVTSNSVSCPEICRWPTVLLYTDERSVSISEWLVNQVGTYYRHASG